MFCYITIITQRSIYYFKNSMLYYSVKVAFGNEPLVQLSKKRRGKNSMRLSIKTVVVFVETGISDSKQGQKKKESF